MILLSTIWHTGTHSAAHHFFGDWQEKLRTGELVWIHCSPLALEMANRVDNTGVPSVKVLTTYRDPVKVAQSWARRGSFSVDTWCEQWDMWGQIIPKAEVHSVDELSVRHASHPNKGNFEVPDGVVEHAQDIVNRVKEFLPFDLTTG